MKVSILSPTQQEFNGKVYYYCTPYYRKGGKCLHRAVWEYHNGVIQAGFHVHHKDGDRENNNIENLQLMPGPNHRSFHAKARPEYLAKQIKLMQDKAKEWHGSKEGREWHGLHAKEMWKSKESQEYHCCQCGKAFLTKHLYGDSQNTFCSNNCKAAYRRVLAVDNEVRKCVYCKRSFTTNKYSKAQCCSRECSAKKRWNK